MQSRYGCSVRGSSGSERLGKPICDRTEQGGCTDDSGSVREHGECGEGRARGIGLDQIIHTGYHTLGLISYLTQGPKETRAWTIHLGDTAPKAAGVIHTDFERGFIRAQVMAYDDFVEKGGEAACREAGLLRTEGKEYVVKDGDVIEFLFNV